MNGMGWTDTWKSESSVPPRRSLATFHPSAAVASSSSFASWPNQSVWPHPSGVNLAPEGREGLESDWLIPSPCTSILSCFCFQCDQFIHPSIHSFSLRRFAPFSGELFGKMAICDGSLRKKWMEKMIILITIKNNLIWFPFLYVLLWIMGLINWWPIIGQKDMNRHRLHEVGVIRSWSHSGTASKDLWFEFRF